MTLYWIFCLLKPFYTLLIIKYLNVIIFLRQIKNKCNPQNYSNKTNKMIMDRNTMMILNTIKTIKTIKIIKTMKIMNKMKTMMTMIKINKIKRKYLDWIVLPFSNIGTQMEIKIMPLIQKYKN
mgnify:CR=1 FL=1